MTRLPLLPALFSSFVLCSTVAVAQTPKLTINGVTSVDNSATPHLKALGSLNITITGTPNAPFALLLSGDANTAMTTGFFLKVWTPSGKNSPIHPVFDGIGTALIASKLGKNPNEFIADTASGFFKFGPSGTFTLTGLVPPVAFLQDTLNPGNPIFLPLESTTTPANVFLYLQVVELNPVSQALSVGNGMKVFFDQVTFPGTIAYTEGVDPNATTTTVDAKQAPGVIVDSDLNAGAVGTYTKSPEFTPFGSTIDIWMIALAGVQPLIPTSISGNTPGGTGSPAPSDPDSSYPTLWGMGSSLEFMTGTTLARNNENKEFPRIRLPGGRFLVHWREASTATPSFGFAVYFEATGTWRNLIPPPPTGLTFTNPLSATKSPWEIEVGVTPDGNRALVVLDNATNAARLFLLNLEPGGNFSNNLPFIERTPPAADSHRLWEESIAFAKNGVGGWVGFIEGTAVAAPTQNTYPNRLFRVNMDGVTAPVQVLPAAGEGRMDRQLFMSPDQTSLALIAANGTSATQERVYSIRNVTPTTHTLTDISKLAKTLNEWSDVYDGLTGLAAWSQDSKRFAFARSNGSQQIPNMAVADGTGAVSEDLILETISGGQFALNQDFPQGRDYCFTTDGKYLVFFQGIANTGTFADDMDQFAVEIATKTSVNLTRTLQGGSYTGPWDPPVGGGPNIDCGGYFVSNDGDTLFWFRDKRAVAPEDPFFDKFNLIATDISVPASGIPPLTMTNITGTEFPPGPLDSPPTFGAPDLNGDGGAAENRGDYMGPRRVGGTGVFKDHYYMIGRLALQTAGSPFFNTDQVFLFDGANPGPAIQLTQFSTTSTPACPNNTHITNVTPSQTQNKVALILDSGGVFTTTAGTLQDLYVLNLDNFGAAVRVPSPTIATNFNRWLVPGSTHWLPSSPEGLLFAEGTVPRASGGTVDGIVDGSIDGTNPIDTVAYFWRFGSALPTAIAAPPPAGNRRLAHIFHVKSP